MYLEDTNFKNFIHQLNNYLMKIKLNIEETNEYLEKNNINDEFFRNSIEKQEKNLAEISEMLKELKVIKMNEALVAEKKEVVILTGKALVIDDEPDLLRVLKRYLEKMGLDVETASCGEEGLDKIRNKNYHYLVTDLKMPGMDGQTLIKLGKEENLFENTIVIAITGGLLNEYSLDERNALRTNIDGFLQKPFSKDDLYNLIRSFEP